MQLIPAGSQPARASHTAKPDPVKVWNQIALESARARRASDADIARLAALVNVAMYDAVNNLSTGCGRADRTHALVPPDRAPSDGNEYAAASAAAHAVLERLFPENAARFAAQLAADLKALPGRSSVNAGRIYGSSIGAQVVAARSNDGSSPVQVGPPGYGVGQFTGAFAGIQYRNLKPFAIANPAEYVTGGPPALESVDYAAAFAEVKVIGSAALVDADKAAIYQYWSLSAGTAQPPGEWMKIAITVTEARAIDLEDKVRLFALVAMALADTVAPTVTTKLTYSSWRPLTAIRAAADDQNPETEANPKWSPRAGTAGSSPEHISGHSSFSAAAATVLAGFFCQDEIAFSHVSDSSLGGEARRFRSFSAAAAEAGRSRVLGGIHFEFSNQAGLEAGRGVASEILGKMLLKRRGKTHHGRCPL